MEWHHSQVFSDGLLVLLEVDLIQIWYELRLQVCEESEAQPLSIEVALALAELD
jgi:hypothetical protein